MEDIKAKVEEYAALARQAAQIKERMEWLKGFFEQQASVDLKDTKLKTAEYWGDNNSCVTVGNSETVRLVSLEMLKEVLGNVTSDFVKEEKTVKLTDPCKRFLAMVCQGNYCEGDIDDTIAAITSDVNLQATLRKKLKGRYDKDKNTLVQLAGLSEQEASDTAYLAAEVINWGWIAQVLAAAGWRGSPQEAIDKIRAAAICEEGVKVGISYEVA